MDYKKILTKANVRDDLKIGHEGREKTIEFDGQRIGRIVSFGKRGGMDRKRIVTVWASRIYQPGLQIEAEASSPASLLEKVATEIVRHLKAAKKEQQAAVVHTLEQDENADGPAPRI